MSNLIPLKANAPDRMKVEGADFVSTADSLLPWKGNDDEYVFQLAAPFKPH